MKKIGFSIAVWLCICAGLAAQSGTITSPMSGANEVWMAGDTKNITWTYSGAATVKLLLFDSTGNKVGPIKSGLSLSAGSHPWTVGTLETGKTVGPAKGYTLQMVRTDGGVSILLCKAGPFEIATAAIIPPAPLPPPPPPGTPVVLRDRRRIISPVQILPMLRVSQPVDGTQLFPGDSCAIEWSLPGDSYANVMILRYPPGQAHLISSGQGEWIAQSAPNTGSFSWKLSELERTGKCVVRVLSSDGKVHGDSGVVTIASKPLPPNQRVHVVARPADSLMAKSATLSVKRVDCFFKDCALTNVIVHLTVDATPSVGQKDVVLSPDVGHPQLGSLYLRCRLEDPYTDSKGKFTVTPSCDHWVSVKGGGGSWKVREVFPQTIPAGLSEVAVFFDLQPPVPRRGQLVAQKMPSSFLGGGNLCKQYYFQKLIITAHLLTHSGDIAADHKQYLTYSENECPLSSITLPGEVNNCWEGVQDW